MRSPIRASDLTDKLTFQVRRQVEDGYGNTEAAFQTEFTVYANMKPLRGGETILAARLSGTLTYAVTVRRTAATLQITPGWRIVDARDNARVLNISSLPQDPDGRGDWLEMLAMQGVAT